MGLTFKELHFSGNLCFVVLDLKRDNKKCFVLYYLMFLNHLFTFNIPLFQTIITAERIAVTFSILMTKHLPINLKTFCDKLHELLLKIKFKHESTSIFLTFKKIDLS